MPSSKRLIWLAALALSLSVLSTAGLAQQPFRSLESLPAAVAEFRVRDTRGGLWDARRMKGKYVLIDFWATWCSPCLAEFPFQKRAYQAYREKGFEILAVSLDAADRRTVERLLKRRAIPWPQILDGRGYSGRLARQFGVEFIPASVMVDPQGKVVAVNLRGDRLLEFLESVLDS